MTSQPRSIQQATWVGWLALAIAAIVSALVLFGLTGCSAVSTSSQSAATTSQSQTTNTTAPKASPSQAALAKGNMPVPTALADAGEYGENIYDSAKTNDWTKASEELAALKKATGQLQAEAKNAAGDETKLDESIKTLEKTIAAKDRQATMREANHVTFVTANMTTAFKRANPVEITLLDYYGRELELDAAANDAPKLKKTTADIRQAWNAVLPSIEAHNGKHEARKFGELVARVDAAKSPADYGRLATPVLDEVDNLEKVFGK